MSAGLGGETYEFGGYKPPSPVRPKAEDPKRSDAFTQTSESGPVIPIVWGTARLAGNLVERTAPFQLVPYSSLYPLGVNRWAASTAYVVGDVAYNVEVLAVIMGYAQSVTRYYWCRAAGTSAAVGGPRGTAADITDGSAHWASISGTGSGYRQALIIGLCEGPIGGLGLCWQDKKAYSSLAALPHVGSNAAVLLGSQPQTRPVFSLSMGFTDPYNNTACVVIDQGSKDTNAAPNLAFEIAGVGSVYGYWYDANPQNLAYDLLTHARRGAGWSPSRVDNGHGAASWYTYCEQAALMLSRVIDSQQSAANLLGDLLTATNTAAVWSSGVLRFVPLCDQPIGTFLPNVTPIYNLGPADVLEGTQIEVERRRPSDCFNSVPVQFIRRADSAGNLIYQTDVLDNPDLSDVDLRGKVVKAPTVALPFVMSPESATMMSRIFCQRSLTLRNTYTVRLPGWLYCLLEPTDIVTLTDPVLGLTKAPARILSFEESVEQDGSSTVTITCEDYPAAAHHAAKYTPQAGDGYRPSSEVPINGILAQPGSGPGVNVLYGSDFSAGIPMAWGASVGGWVLGGQPSAGWGSCISDLTTGPVGTAWAGPSGTLGGDADPKNLYHNNTWLFVENARAADGTILYATASAQISIDPAKRYAWSIYCGVYQCIADVYLAWFQADGSLSAIKGYSFPTADGVNNQEAWSGVSLASFKRLFVVDTPPSDAASVKPYIRKYDTVAGQTLSEWHLARAQFEEVDALAIVPGPWVAGPQSIVTNQARTGMYRAWGNGGSFATFYGDSASAYLSSLGIGGYRINDARITAASTAQAASVDNGSGYQTAATYCAVGAGYADVHIQYVNGPGAGQYVTAPWSVIIYI